MYGVCRIFSVETSIMLRPFCSLNDTRSVWNCMKYTAYLK